MNNGNNPYSAYDLMGRPRGPAYSTRQFIRAWRRIALIMRGGPLAVINRRLRRLHMLRVRTGLEMLPRAPVSLMWVPLSFGNPEIPKNHPRYWWPGCGYVDWVGTTWYSMYKASAAMDRIYNYPLWRCKPFAFAGLGHLGPRRPRLHAAVLQVPPLPPPRADGGLLPVRVAEAGVPAVHAPAGARGATARPEVAGNDRRGADPLRR